MFASKGLQLGEGNVGADRGGFEPRRGCSIRCPAPTTSPAWRPARCLMFRARSRSLSTNTQASWKMCSFVWPSWTGLSTNASCQPEKPESSQAKTRGSASTLGVEPAPRERSLATGENARPAKTRAILGIPATDAAAAPVNKMGASSWGRSVVAPQKPLIPTTSPPEPASISHPNGVSADA
jgi:hypothetical protein